jgi:hypothetical protein
VLPGEWWVCIAVALYPPYDSTILPFPPGKSLLQ